MGITIHYRGRLADLARAEDFEDRLLDLALDIGGLARMWRTVPDEAPARKVRGIILNLAPGQEPVSLLLSAEGWLIGMAHIGDAGCGRLTGPPWCFTKTQFGPLEGHVALVELLAALRREFLPDLEVTDEGGYWETRDLAELARRMALIQHGIDGMAEGLQRGGLSREAAEDPDILLRRIERIAAQVHRTLRRPAEHPPVAIPDDEFAGAADREADEALAEELFKHNRRQQERLLRALEEWQARGEKDEELDDLTREFCGEEPEPDGEPWLTGEQDSFAFSSGEGSPEAAEDENADLDDAAMRTEQERPPLLERGLELLRSLHTAFHDAGPEFGPSLHTLFQGGGEVMGGLAQGLSEWDEDDSAAYGLRISQLKRALRASGFACGALYPLRAATSTEQFAEFQRTLRQLEQDIFQEIGRLRSEHPAEES